MSKYVATSSLDGKIKLWDINEPQLMTELEDNTVKKGRMIVGFRSRYASI